MMVRQIKKKLISETTVLPKERENYSMVENSNLSKCLPGRFYCHSLYKIINSKRIKISKSSNNPITSCCTGSLPTPPVPHCAHTAHHGEDTMAWRPLSTITNPSFPPLIITPIPSTSYPFDSLDLFLNLKRLQCIKSSEFSFHQPCHFFTL